MALGFDSSHAPFDRLSGPEIEGVRAALDIGYFRAGETIIDRGAAPENLFIVMKGRVEEREGAQVAGIVGPGDAFDAHALVQSGGGLAFVAAEETLCYLLPRAQVMRLIAANPRFAAYFYLEISRKFDAAAAETEAARFDAMVHTHVRDLHLHPAVFCEASDSIETVGRQMSEARANALFVRDGERTGFVTATRLGRAAILERAPLDGPVGPWAQFSPPACEINDPVSEALLKMTLGKARRVAVRDGNRFVGVLEDIDLLAHLAGGSQLVAARLDRARSLEELAPIAGDIQRQIRVLRRQGVKIQVVCEIVSDLNRRLMARAFRLTAPQSVQEHGCLIVMGSEGRGEQTLRTDQDNALILSATVPDADLESFRRDFFAALESFGFPPCPGGVMAQNAQWSKTVDAYLEDINVWCASGEESMNVAILCDAAIVAGDGDLLARVRAELWRLMRSEPARMAHFARAIDQFPTPVGFFRTLFGGREDEETVDLKKGGVFPIVHGARALALEQGIEETNTAKRILRLAERGALDAEFARELRQALYCLMTMKLDARLALGPAGATLTSMDRDLIRDALKIVRRFKETVRRRFRLEMF